MTRVTGAAIEPVPLTEPGLTGPQPAPVAGGTLRVRCVSLPILVRDASPAQTASWDGRSSAASAMRAEDEEGVRSINQGVSQSIYLEARGRGPSPLSDAGAPRALIGWTDGVPLHQSGSLPPPFLFSALLPGLVNIVYMFPVSGRNLEDLMRARKKV